MARAALAPESKTETRLEFRYIVGFLAAPLEAADPDPGVENDGTC